MIRFLSILAFLAVMPPAFASDISIRPSVRVAGPLVLLGDVLEEAGEAASRTIARSPEPGASMSLPLSDIVRVARDAGFKDMPMQSGYVRVVRAAHAVPETAIISMLEEAIAGQGDGGRYQVRISGQRGSFYVPIDADPLDFRLEGLRLDGQTGGRFSARLLLPGDGGILAGVEISGTAEPLMEVPVLLRDVTSGEQISSRDIGMAEIIERRIGRNTITDMTMLAGKEATRPLRAGGALRIGDVRAPVLVARGAIVTVRIVMAGMSLSTTAKAMQEGTEGDIVRLLNLATNRALEGRVVGYDQVVAITPFSVSSAN